MGIEQDLDDLIKYMGEQIKIKDDFIEELKTKLTESYVLVKELKEKNEKLHKILELKKIL